MKTQQTAPNLSGAATYPGRSRASDISSATNTTVVHSSLPLVGREKTDSAITQYVETELGVIGHTLVVWPFCHRDECRRLCFLCCIWPISAPRVHRA